MRNKSYSKSLTKHSFKFRFNKHDLIGAPDAETDKVLTNVFIDTGAYEVLIDIDNPKCIINGRTGSGKSALIKKIVSEQTNVVRISPESLALKYLVNSTILEYFRSIGIRLNFFYKVLWKHIFIVELLKLYLGETNDKKQSLFQSLWSKINTGGKTDVAKQAALEYFDKWSDEFWLKTEHRVKTLESDLEKQFLFEMGLDSSFFKAGGKSSDIVKEKSIAEVKHKAEQIISDIQAQDLITLIEILKNNVFNNNQRKFYLVIDDLDKEWASPQIVYDLIGAMIEIVKEFQEKFEGVKIILALRDNLHQIIFYGKEHRGGQREKFAPLFLNLTWDEYALREVIDSRLKLLSNEQLNINSVFDKSSKSKVSGLEYILERTYYRPRDIISFFNKIIENANNKTHLTNNLIKNAEPSYSIERLHGLEDEWNENYGDISKLCKFLFGVHNGFNIYNIKEDSFADLLFSNDYADALKGEALIHLEEWKKSDLKPSDFRKFLSEILFILFKIGVIGVKRKPELKTEFFYNSETSINPSDFLNDGKIYVHKALFSVFKVNSKEMEADYLD